MKTMIAVVLLIAGLTGGLAAVAPATAQSSPCTTNPSRC